MVYYQVQIITIENKNKLSSNLSNYLPHPSNYFPYPLSIFFIPRSPIKRNYTYDTYDQKLKTDFWYRKFQKSKNISC